MLTVGGSDTNNLGLGTNSLGSGINSWDWVPPIGFRYQQLRCSNILGSKPSVEGEISTFRGQLLTNRDRIPEVGNKVSTVYDQVSI